MARVLKRETTLSRKMRTLLRDSTVLPRAALVEAALGGAISLAAMVRQALFLPNRTLWFLAGSLAALAIGHTLKARERRTEAGRVAAGRKGERQVSARLAKLPDDAIVLNDVHVKSGPHNAQIDHLVISPRGIFVLESKRWRGRIEGDERAATWRQVRPDGRHVRLHNPVRQIQRQADLLRDYLRARGVGTREVRGLLVSSIPGTRFSIAHRTTPIFEPDEAARHIETVVPERSLTREEIEAVLAALEIHPGR